MKYEKISALVDGELDEGELGPAMEALRSSEGQAALDLYYKIGDALKAKSANAKPSPEFARRMAILLEAEQPLGDGPSNTERVQSQLEEMAMQQLDEDVKALGDDGKVSHSLKHLTIPGIAAIAAVAVVMTPKFMFVVQANASSISSASYSAIAGAAILAQNLFIG